MTTLSSSSDSKNLGLASLGAVLEYFDFQGCGLKRCLERAHRGHW